MIVSMDYNGLLAPSILELDVVMILEKTFSRLSQTMLKAGQKRPTHFNGNLNISDKWDSEKAIKTVKEQQEWLICLEHRANIAPTNNSATKDQVQRCQRYRIHFNQQWLSE